MIRGKGKEEESTQKAVSELARTERCPKANKGFQGRSNQLCCWLDKRQDLGINHCIGNMKVAGALTSAVSVK